MTVGRNWERPAVCGNCRRAHGSSTNNQGTIGASRVDTVVVITATIPTRTANCSFEDSAKRFGLQGEYDCKVESKGIQKALERHSWLNLNEQMRKVTTNGQPD